MPEIPTTYRPGELVDVVLYRAVVTAYDPTVPTPTVRPQGESETTIAVHPACRTVGVRRVAPPEWPPVEPGELWRDCDGGLWMYQTRQRWSEYSGHTRTELVMTPATDRGDGQGAIAEARFLEQCGPVELVWAERPAPGRAGPSDETADGWRDEATGLVSGGLVTG